MTTISAKFKTIRSLPIARRNQLHPFEFGAVQKRDRIMVTSRLDAKRQGRLLDASSTLDTSLVLPGSSTPPGTRSAAAAFRSVQRFFESAAVEKRLTPWRVLGFMSDSLVPNGLAGVLHDEDEKVQFINVTAGAFFHTLYSAYHLVSDKRFEPLLPRPGEHIEAHAEQLFRIALNIPVAPERRALAGRYAVAALRVTFFHELAHILRAHPVYLRRETGAGSGAIAEVSSSEFASSPTIDLRLRALETDADDFSGRFMAKQFFSGFQQYELSLENPRFRAKAAEVLVGVVLMYSWFAESEGYHSGSLRAYWLLGSMFAELGLDVKTSARWVSDRVTGLQSLMIERGLLPRGVGFISEIKLQELTKDTLAYRKCHMHEWLQLRPWGFDGNR